MPQFTDEQGNVYALREGQTFEEFEAEAEASKVRLELGLPPGRTMPTKEEIAAGPLPPPPPEPDRIAALEARLALVELRTKLARA